MKTKAMLALRENFDLEKMYVAEAIEKSENIMQKCTQEEANHGKVIAELIERIKGLEKDKANFDAIIKAKEAEVIKKEEWKLLSK